MPRLTHPDLPGSDATVDEHAARVMAKSGWVPFEDEADDGTSEAVCGAETKSGEPCSNPTDGGPCHLHGG